MYCNQCGKQISDGSRFCNFCGANLTAVQSAPRSVPVQNNPYFDIRHGVLVKYTGRDKNVVVPAGVVEVEENAFTGYDMDSITFPEGCKRVYVDTFVKEIRFPSSIEEFKLNFGGKVPGRCSDDVYFAPGIKKIKGFSRPYKNRFADVLKRDPVMKIHIPNTVEDIRELNCRHYFERSDVDYYFDYLVFDNLDAFSPEMRRQIYQWRGRCGHCGGYLKDTIFGNQKCEVCGKKKDYEFGPYGWIKK